MIANECNIEAEALRFERYSMLLVYLNALLFSALFTSNTVSAYLVRAVFNGTGIAMVTGLASLLFGNLYAFAVGQPPQKAAKGAYFASKVLFLIQGVLLMVLTVLVVVKIIY
jgi:hypothetical protein